VSYVQTGDQLLVITQQGMILRLLTDDVRSIGRATQGVTIIDLEENDKVVSIARLVEKEDEDAAAAAPSEPAPEPPAE
jgi:DNA gyrase subunit A